MIARISTLTAVVLSAGLVLSAASPAVAKDRHKHRDGVFTYGAITSGGDGKHRKVRRIIIHTGKFGYPPAIGYATGAPARGYPMVGYPTGMAPKGYATGHAIGGMAPKSYPTGDVAGGMPPKDKPAGDMPAKDEPAGDTTGDAAPPASDPPAVTAPAEPAEEPDADDADDADDAAKAARARVEQKK